MTIPEVVAARAAIAAAGGLISLQGIADERGVSRQQASLYSLDPSFPEEIHTEGTPRVQWFALEVRAWFEARENR